MTRTKSFLFRLSEPEVEQLRAQARARGLSCSAYLRLVLHYMAGTQISTDALLRNGSIIVQKGDR